MTIEYSVNICKNLQQQFCDIKLYRPIKIDRYDDGDELSLQVEETGYQITRNRQAANGLSEGEHTAIALLYFLKSLADKDFDLSRGIESLKTLGLTTS